MINNFCRKTDAKYKSYRRNKYKYIRFRIAQYENMFYQNWRRYEKFENSMDFISNYEEELSRFLKNLSSQEEQGLWWFFKKKKFDKYMESHKQLLVVSRQNKTEEAQKST